MTLLLLAACSQQPWFEGRWSLVEIETFAGTSRPDASARMTLDDGDLEWEGVRGSYLAVETGQGTAVLDLYPDDGPTLRVELREQDDGGLLLRQNAVLTHRFERVD